MTDKEDAIDVEFETVAKSAPPWAKQFRPSSNAEISKDQDQLSIFGKIPNQSKKKGMSLPVFTLVASICSLTAFYFAGGYILFQSPAIMEATQIAAEQSDKSTLQFQNISTNRLIRKNHDILTIEATIINTGKIARTLPPIIIYIGKDPKTKRKLRISRGETLNPDERLMFTNSLPLGKGIPEEIELTFAE